MTRRLMEGSDAIAEAMIAAGCRFFAGYPITPFTEVLEGMARMLPDVDGVCMNAESEIEAVGMAWGAAAAGVRSATGSCGQGLSLMQESLAEISYAQVPLVVLNMARSQGDYFQATRGGGHGDYRHIVLAPCDIGEAVHLIQYAFHLADVWRNPVMFMGDYYLAHVQEAVDPAAIDFGPRIDKPWALDGSSSGGGNAKIVSGIFVTKRDAPHPVTIGEHLVNMGNRAHEISQGMDPLVETGYTEDADVVVVAYGTPGRFVRYVVGQLRAQGHRVGFVRPITLWPFPADALRAATRSARMIAVYELNTGQMKDDVELSVRDRPTCFIGGISTDDASFGIAPMLTSANVTARILKVLDEIDQKEPA